MILTGVFVKRWLQDGRILPWAYCNKIWMNGESSPKELSDYDPVPPEDGESFRFYTVKFDISNGEKLAKSILGGENSDATDEKGETGSCFLASSTDNMVMNFDLGSKIIAGKNYFGLGFVMSKNLLEFFGKVYLRNKS